MTCKFILVHARLARTGRNPKTGESVQLAAKVAIHFKPSKDFKNRVYTVKLMNSIEQSDT